MDPDEQAFHAAMAASPMDEAPRKVFADWLDERGRDDEATYWRKWTWEVAKAEGWLREFARLADMTYERVIMAAVKMRDTGERTGTGMRFTPGDVMANYGVALMVPITGVSVCGWCNGTGRHRFQSDANECPSCLGSGRMPNTVDSFWKCIELVLGVPVPQESAREDLFMCCEYDDDTPEEEDF